MPSTLTKGSANTKNSEEIATGIGTKIHERTAHSISESAFCPTGVKPAGVGIIVRAK
jgi:hypothetical protein